MAFETDETNAQLKETKSMEGHVEHVHYCAELHCSNEPERYGVIKIGHISMAVCLCTKHTDAVDIRIGLKNAE